MPWYVALLIAAGAAAFSMVVGFGGWVRVRSWQRGAARDLLALRGAAGRAAAIHAARYTFAVGLAGSLGVLSGSGHPHWAMAAAAVPLAGADLPSRVRRGIHRIVGTFLGLAVTAVVLVPAPWSLAPLFAAHQVVVLALLVIVFQFTTELFMTRHYGLAMVSFTPVILLMTQLAAPTDPSLLILERGVETFVGAVVGILVVMAVRQRVGRPPTVRIPLLRSARRPGQ